MSGILEYASSYHFARGQPMPEYRRWLCEGGTFFLTIVTGKRRPIFADPAAVHQLRQSLRVVRAEFPFEILAAVVMPDHVHLLTELPPKDSNYSKRIGRMKVLFSQQYLPSAPTLKVAPSKKRHRETGVWHRRFWEHTIRSEGDFLRHVDYIHFNPIKHGLAPCAHAWPYSSFQRWVKLGHYAPNWCCACDDRTFTPPSFDDIDERTGE
jgi:putative transposase